MADVWCRHCAISLLLRMYVLYHRSGAAAAAALHARYAGGVPAPVPAAAHPHKAGPGRRRAARGTQRPGGGLPHWQGAAPCKTSAFVGIQSYGVKREHWCSGIYWVKGAPAHNSKYLELWRYQKHTVQVDCRFDESMLQHLNSPSKSPTT